MSKEKFTAAYEIINKIEDLFIEADNLFDMIKPDIKQAIYDYHNETATLQYCIRWGLQAPKEIREDWHTVVSDIPCGE